MLAAIYARKSTEQTTADAEAKSVARQIESARAFAKTKGWTVEDRHVYADDAISGADTQKLVNRKRLLDVIAARPPFQVLIVRDASRLSREDGDEAFGELKRIAQGGIEIWFYSDGTRFEYGNFGDNIKGFVNAEMNAEYRRQIAKWTREAMVRKAQAGHVTGGRVFGYDLVDVIGGRRVRRAPGAKRHPDASHVEHCINKAEATVVRRIFALCASGTGYTRIAKQLNAARVPSPRPQQQRPIGWSPSTIHDVLHRELYRGEVVWNKTRKRDSAGKTAPTARPASEWLQTSRPELRIVSDDVWNAVDARLKSLPNSFATSGRSRQARRRDVDSKYLLSGFARCATCGGTLSVLSRSHGKKRLYLYGCLAHAKRGATVCDNALVKPLTGMDDAVLKKLGKDVLRPAVVRALLDVVFAALEPAAVTTNVDDLTKDLHALDQKIARLSVAVEEGGALAPLVAKLKQRQTERDALLAAIGAADAVTQLRIDRREVTRKVLAQVEAWRTLHATDGRQFLREVVDGPIRFTPDGKSYRFEGSTTTGRLIAGLIGDSTFCGVPKGIREKVEIRFSGIAA